MTERYIDLLDPRGVPQQGTYNLAQRPTTLRGATFGILSNSKPNGDLLLQAIGRELAERFDFEEVIYRHKESARPPRTTSWPTWRSVTSFSTPLAIEVRARRGVSTTPSSWKNAGCRR